MKLSQLTKYAGIGIVAGIAAYASYTHMRELALDHGQTAMVASLLPVSVDGMLVVTTMVMREDRQADRKVRVWAWIAFILGVAASVVANVLAAADDITSRVISAWPAIALLLVIEVLATGKKAAELPPEAAADSRRRESISSPIGDKIVLNAHIVNNENDLPAEVAPTVAPETVARSAAHKNLSAGDLPAEVTPAKPAAKKAAPVKKTTPRRPVEETRKLAAEALAAAPDVTRKAVAEQLDITPRRLRQALSEDTGRDVLAEEAAKAVVEDIAAGKREAVSAQQLGGMFGKSTEWAADRIEEVARRKFNGTPVLTEQSA